MPMSLERIRQTQESKQQLCYTKKNLRPLVKPNWELSKNSKLILKPNQVLFRKGQAILVTWTIIHYFLEHKMYRANRLTLLLTDSKLLEPTKKASVMIQKLQMMQRLQTLVTQ